MKPQLSVKILHKHSRHCAMLHSRYVSNRDNPWAYFGSRDRLPDKSGFERVPLALYRTSNGKKLRGGGSHRWITAGCNDCDCPAVVAVREADLLALVESALKGARK